MPTSLSTETIDKLLAVKKQLDQNEILNKLAKDFEGSRVINLKDSMDKGDFEVPSSDLPVDVHQFFTGVQEYASDKVLKSDDIKSYDFTYNWAYNVLSVNYPLISFSLDFYTYYKYMVGNILPKQSIFLALIDFYNEYYINHKVLGKHLHGAFEDFYRYKLVSRPVPTLDAQSEFIFELYRYNFYLPHNEFTSCRERYYNYLLPKSLFNNRKYDYNISPPIIIRNANNN